MPDKPEVIELTDIPECEPNTSDAVVLSAGRRAFVAYDTTGPDRNFALIQLDGVSHIVTGGPNDEAFHRHPFFKLGLSHYAIQEIICSPWIPEILALLHMDGLAPNDSKDHHFVFALKETSVDVIAQRLTTVGVFPSLREAMTAACTRAFS